MTIHSTRDRCVTLQDLRWQNEVATPLFECAEVLRLPRVIGYPKAPSSLCFAGAVHDDFGGRRALREKVAVLNCVVFSPFTHD
jgi:hypothetical protein